MPSREWTRPDDLRQQTRRLWERGKVLEAGYPLRLRLVAPQASELAPRFDEVRQWIRDLSAASKEETGFGYAITWTEREHRQLGRNRVPAGVLLPTRDDAVRLIGRAREARAYDALLEQTRELLPRLESWIRKRPLRALEHRDVWPRALCVVRWLLEHPESGLYVRQIDLPGIDTKFIELHRSLIDELVQHQAPDRRGADFEERHGLRRKPTLVRFRSLDPAQRVGPFSDLTVPVSELAAWAPRATVVFITENELNGLAFPQRRDSLVIFRLGYGVALLDLVPWLTSKHVYYWGDIDTHGFAMLDRVRGALPGARSFLMDRQTFLDHRSSWVAEPRPHRGELPRLTAAEAALYDELCRGAFGGPMRLEQERLGFGYLERALAAKPEDVDPPGNDIAT